MNSTLKKILNDLRAYPGRTALVIFALVIGLWGAGSVLVSPQYYRQSGSS